MRKIIVITLAVCIAIVCLAFTPASQILSFTITSFNTGQVSWAMEERTDFPKYPSFCRTVENMITLSQGPMTRRPGTKYIATVKTSGAILQLFEFSTGDTYGIEAGYSYFRFFRDGGQILNGVTPYEISTPYSTATELSNLKCAQSDNIMYFVDGNHPPYKLTRQDHNDWTLEDANIITGPFLPENTEDINIVPSGTTGSVRLIANSNIFNSGHIGSIWEISQPSSAVTYTGTLDANESSLQTDYFQGGYSFITEGTWAGTVTLERSTNGGITWGAALSPLTDTNFDNPAETEDDGAVYRVTMSGYTSGSCSYTLTVSNVTNAGVVKITSYTDANDVNATVITELASTSPTKQWREGYWSDYRGWPKTVCFHQQRLIFGGSTTFPQTLWFGEANPDEYENFDDGANDDDAFTVGLPGQNPVTWLLSEDFLFIGTSGSCGKYGSQGEAITPTSPNYREQTRFGSANIQAILAGDNLLYVERGGARVRELSYSLQYDKHLSNNLMLLSEDISGTGITDIAFQLRPYPVLWCVLSDGDIATLTYQKDQEIIAWAKQTTDGDFKSVVAIPSSGKEDEIWVVVERDVNGTGVQYVEQFQPFDWGTDSNDCWFVDCGLDYDSTATDTFAGLDHLEAKSVSVYAGGIACSDETVSSGQITIDNSSCRVIVGLPFTSKLETVPIYIDPQDRALNKKILCVWADFYNTGYCEYGLGENSAMTSCRFFNQDYITQARQPLYTSTDAPWKLTFTYGSKKKATLYMQTDKPQPLTIRSLTPEFDLVGN
ncbi:MAG: hypothetical protein PHQ00_00015 [Phycisphaerae bacterium]|nr:hypothetical protein [Phycisphaerae bacterium]